MFDKKLMKVGEKVANYLNLNGFNIDTVQAFSKGQRVLLTKFKEDRITFNQYFEKSWDSGIQLAFTISDDRLKFLGYGAFKWRNEKYNTPENMITLNILIKEVENFKL